MESRLSYPTRTLVHSLPGLVQRGGDQTAAEFISCWLFHIPFHPTYSHPSPQTYSFPVISRLWLWELPGLLWLLFFLPLHPVFLFFSFFFFYEPNQWTKKKKKSGQVICAEWIVSSFITGGTGGLSAPIKATIHFHFSLPDMSMKRKFSYKWHFFPT